jgi:hypothetical protein
LQESLLRRRKRTIERTQAVTNGAQGFAFKLLHCG